MRKYIPPPFSLSLFLPTIILLTLVLTVQAADMLSVAADGVNLRSGPGTTHDISWEYGKGFPLEIISRDGDWYNVKDFEGDTGWIYKPLLSSKKHVIVNANKAGSQKVNIRSSPVMSAKVVGRAYYGVVFEMLEQKDGWTKVQHESGLVGWISNSLLWGF